MPSLIVSTSPTKTIPPNGFSPTSTRQSRSESPARPPVSPITPTLQSARLARQTYTHSQPPQVAISAPTPEPIRFEDNPDVLATKSAISILMMQARRATGDIQTLQRSKEHALQDPEGFLAALEAGEIRYKGEPFMGLSQDDDEDEDEEDGQNVKQEEERKTWERLPKAQDVVRMPHVNWDQYAVVGESLEKLHADQLRHPPEGMPQRMGVDGQLVTGWFGSMPATPAREKAEKMGTRKGGKR